MVLIPTELDGFFLSEHFQQYPKISIPQSFIDLRGKIINIADGQLGDVAIISSVKGAIRANHVHRTDWHLTYCVSGSLKYSYENREKIIQTIEIRAGELFYTPAEVPHRMDFLEETILVVVSRNSRKSEYYDSDTSKVELRLNK